MSKLLMIIMIGIVGILLINMVSGKEFAQKAPVDAKEYAAVCNGVLVFSIGGCNVSQQETSNSNNDETTGRESPTEMILSAVAGIGLLGVVLLGMRKPSGSSGRGGDD